LLSVFGHLATLKKREYSIFYLLVFITEKYLFSEKLDKTLKIWYNIYFFKKIYKKFKASSKEESSHF